MASGDKARFADLRAVDVSDLLKRGKPEIGALIDHGRYEEACQMIEVWEVAFGGELDILAAKVNEVRGQEGYIRALAALSRSQEDRARSIDRFTIGVFSRSRRMIDRWSWAPSAYRLSVEAFIAQRAIRMRDRKWRPTLSRQLLASSIKQRRVLRAIAESNDNVVEDYAERPYTFHYVLGRVSALIEEDARIGADEATLIGQRDQLREASKTAGLTSTDRSRIARMASVRAQIRAFESAREAEVHGIALASANESAARINGQLRMLLADSELPERGRLLGLLGDRLSSPNPPAER